MICPNCGSNVSDKRTRCDRCGMDLTLYKRIIRTSNLYYNDGLSRAKVRDLSGAVISLRNSVKLNKLNTNARNLLGLIYYEIGETVAALSEWVISKHFQSDNNDADGYISELQSNPTKLDNLGQAIKRYNNALMSAKQGSDDLAIIQLKKVITLNTHFIRAYQLLALLYMKNGEAERAKKYLIKVAKIDVSNTITLRYIRELTSPEGLVRDGDNAAEGEPGIAGGIKPITSYTEDKPNIIAYINLILGVIIGVALMALVVLPSLDKGKSADDNSMHIDLSASQARIEELEDEKDVLLKGKKELEDEIIQLRSQLDSNVVVEANPKLYDELFTVTQKYLVEITKAVNARDMKGIAATLNTISDEKYETEMAKALLNSLKLAVYPEASGAHYKTGRDYYKTDNFSAALVEFEKAYAYDPANFDAIYYIARSYDHLDNYEQAVLYYNIVIEDFPDSDRFQQANEYLANIPNQ